jgi:hypothetical protein
MHVSLDHQFDQRNRTNMLDNILPPYRIIGQLHTSRQTLTFNFSQEYKIYYIKIISLDSYSKELSNGIIFFVKYLIFS